VITTDKRPISDAKITVKIHGRVVGHATSNYDGEFEISLSKDGRLVLEATHAEYSRVELKRLRVPDSPIDVVMRPGGSLSGRVIDDWTGEPLVKAAVRVGNGTGEGPNRRKIDRGVRTDKEGNWTLEGIPPGRYSVAASALGFAVGVADIVDVAEGQTVDDIIIRLQREGTVTGTVLNDTTGEPISGAMVSFQPAYPAGPRRARSDSGGRFTLKGVTPGRVTIQASARGYITRWISGLDIAPGETLHHIEIRLQQPGSSIGPEAPSHWRRARIQYAGIGARLKQGIDGPIITNTFDNGPASSIGLLPGDEILEVDGVSLAGKSLRDATELIKGKEGEGVRLKIRSSDGSTRIVTPVRQLVQM